MTRAELLAAAKARTASLRDRHPALPVLASIARQIDHLLDHEAGAGGRFRPEDVVVGPQAAREVETLDPELAAMLYDVDAEAKAMAEERRRATPDHAPSAPAARPPTRGPRMNDAPRPTAEQELDAYAHAVWTVGNMDTPEDKAAWWRDNRAVWEAASLRVERMAERGVVADAGFEATGLPAPTSRGLRPRQEPGRDSEPVADLVAGVLEDLGGAATATELCDALVAHGYARRAAQLGIQRAGDAGCVATGADWRIRLP